MSATFCLLARLHQTLQFHSFLGTRLHEQFKQLLTDFWRSTLFSKLSLGFKFYFDYLSDDSFLKCFPNGPLCREDYATSICVVDKINIFRPDRVFMVNMLFRISLYAYFRIPFIFNSFVQLACSMLFVKLTANVVLQFIVELHYKIAAATHHRHACHRLVGVEVLIDILGYRAAVASTSK